MARNLVLLGLADNFFLGEFERNLAENLRQEAKLKDSDVNRKSAQSSSIRTQDTLQAAA